MRPTRWITPAFALLLGGCTCRPQRDSAPTAVSTTTNSYVYFNDGHTGSRAPRENYFGPDLEVYDVRDLDRLHGAVEVILLRLPELAREQGATWADLGDGHLRVAGPPKTQGFVREVLAILRAAPGPR